MAVILQQSKLFIFSRKSAFNNLSVSISACTFEKLVYFYIYDAVTQDRDNDIYKRFGGRLDTAPQHFSAYTTHIKKESTPIDRHK